MAIAASIICLVSGTLSSCTNAFSNSQTNTDTNTYTATNTSTQSQDGDRNTQLQSVGVTVGDLSNPFFVVMAQGAEKEAKKIGGDDVKGLVIIVAVMIDRLRKRSRR